MPINDLRMQKSRTNHYQAKDQKRHRRALKTKDPQQPKPHSILFFLVFAAGYVF